VLVNVRLAICFEHKLESAHPSESCLTYIRIFQECAGLLASRIPEESKQMLARICLN
jgi:hypothetical protein